MTQSIDEILQEKKDYLEKMAEQRKEKELKTKFTAEDLESSDWENKAIFALSNMDYEEYHGRADDILCEILIKLGYKHIVEAYNKIPKWYE